MRSIAGSPRGPVGAFVVVLLILVGGPARERSRSMLPSRLQLSGAERHPGAGGRPVLQPAAPETYFILERG